MKQNNFGRNKRKENEAEYVMLDPEVTDILYPNILRLTIERTGKVVRFQKDIVNVGRSASCDLLLEGKVMVARQQATFFYEHEKWYLHDNYSTNGTWLNGVKLQPGKKYQLAVNDEINFAMAEKLTFYKRENSVQAADDPDAKAVEMLETSMEIFAKSNQTDEVALKLIAVALSEAPLYFPVEIDMEAMFGSVDYTELKTGELIRPQKDVKMRILTMTAEKDLEFIPVFTSKDEMNKGPGVSVIRYYPQDYLQMVLQLDKPIIINPFSDFRFYMNTEVITEVLIPIVQSTKNQHTSVNEPSEQDKYVGTVVDGRYTVLKSIGQGGFYTTYLVQDTKNKKTLAMKTCDKKGQNYSPDIRDVILKEPYMMMKLCHPAIPQVMDVIENEDGIFIIREYVEGTTLESVVKNSGPQPAERVVQWGKELCDMLCYLHGLSPAHIYRDMKPSNVILMPDGHLKVIDFGITRMYDPMKTRDTCFLGTRGYAAPEQFGGNSQTDARTDVFGLGMTMYYLLTGMSTNEPPFAAVPIRQIDSSLPKGLEYIILKCIRNDPNERYQSCDELMRDLNNYMNLPKPKGIFSKLFERK